MTPLDPKTVLDALLAQTGLPFPTEAVDRARKLALAPEAAATAEVEGLPEPLALAVVEAAVRALVLPLFEALGGSSRKALAKAAKKALYQLKSAGVALPASAGPTLPDAPSIAPSTQEELPALLSPLLGTGERYLLVPRTLRAGGLELIQCVFSDEHGIVQLGTGELGRGAYRKQLKAVQSGPNPAGITLPRAEALTLLAHAAWLNQSTASPLPEGAGAILRHLEVEPAPQPVEIPAPQPDDAASSADAVSLHGLPEFLPWLPPEGELRQLALKLDEISASPLYLDEAQRAAQLAHQLRASAEAFFTPERRALYARRLWSMAHYLGQTSRPEMARLAQSESRRLAHEPSAASTGFGLALFEKVLMLTDKLRSGRPLPTPSAPPDAAPK